MLSLLNKYKYLLFILIITMLHLLLNTYPAYKISGFNKATYSYLYVSFTSILILTALFYLIVNYYKKLDKYFYYTFLIYFVVLFLFSILFYPSVSTGDTQGIFISAIETLTLSYHYLFVSIFYTTMLWLTSIIYMVTIFQILLISFIFAYFTSFVKKYLNIKWLILFNCFFILNPIFWSYSCYIQQNIPATYLVIFLGIFIFKSFMTNTFLDKKNLIITYIIIIITSLTRAETIIIPFVSFFIFCLYYLKNKISFNDFIKNSTIFVVSIIILLVIKFINPFYHSDGASYYSFPVYENIIRGIISNPKYNDDSSSDYIKNNIKKLYKDINYKNITSIWHVRDIKISKDIWENAIWILDNNLTSTELKKTTIILLAKHPILFLEKQYNTFYFAAYNLGNIFYTSYPISPNSKSRLNYDNFHLKTTVSQILFNNVPHFFYKGINYISFFVLVFCILGYRYIFYTSCIAILILSSKLIVFFTAFEPYFMQYLALYYALPVILLMAFVELKVHRNKKKLGLSSTKYLTKKLNKTYLLKILLSFYLYLDLWFV